MLLKARFTRHGRVDEVQGENSAGHSELDRAAIEARRRWRFEPVRRGPEPVAVWVVIPFQLYK
jgi:protein TonB